MMGGGFVLKPLDASDLDRAATLHGAAFAAMGERTWTRQEVAELLASPGAAGLLLAVDDCAIGFVLYRVAADEAELLTIAVSAAQRRQGRGWQLLMAAIDRVRAAGAQMLFLEVGADNPEARALYAAAGFQAVGLRPAYYRRDERPPADAIVMRLTLI